MRVEVKWRGGRLAPFAKDVPPNLTPCQSARWYVCEVSRADFIAIGYVEEGPRRLGKARTPEQMGKVWALLIPKARVLWAIDRLEKSENGQWGCLKVVGGQVKVTGVDAGRVKTAFGDPKVNGCQMHLIPDLHKCADLQPDPGCKLAPYARAWEKVVATATGGKWVGALKGAQVDVIVNDNDD